MAYPIDEIPAMTGVPLKTVRREIRDGYLPTCRFNAKAEVVLEADILEWLRRRRSIPASPQTRAVLKKHRSRGASRPTAMLPESEEKRRRRAKFDDIKRRLGRG